VLYILIIIMKNVLEKPLFTLLTERCTLLMCDYVQNTYYSEQCVTVYNF